MIRALVAGELVANPQERTGKTGKIFALARLSVPQGEGGRVFCSVICFEDTAVARLLQLKSGASVALAGTLKVSTWTAKDGTARPALEDDGRELVAPCRDRPGQRLERCDVLNRPCRHPPRLRPSHPAIRQRTP